MDAPQFPARALRGLYPIIDVSSLQARGLDPLAVARVVLRHRPPLLQLRAKELSARATLGLLRALAPLCAEAETALVANDRPDLALLAEAPFVHLGQDDLALADLRGLPGKLRVGVSTHDLAQLRQALEQRPDYVAFGPVFGTVSKVKPDPVVGLDGLAVAASLSRQAGVPLVAIGGLTPERLPEAARHAHLCAVIGALLPEPAPREASEPAPESGGPECSGGPPFETLDRQLARLTRAMAGAPRGPG